MLRFARIIDTFGVGSLRSRLSRLREIRLHDDERMRSEGSCGLDFLNLMTLFTRWRLFLKLRVLLIYDKNQHN